MTTERALDLAYRLLKSFGEAENLYRDYQEAEKFTDDEFDELLTKLDQILCAIAQNVPVLLAFNEGETMGVLSFDRLRHLHGRRKEKP